MITNTPYFRHWKQWQLWLFWVFRPLVGQGISITSHPGIRQGILQALKSSFSYIVCPVGSSAKYYVLWTCPSHPIQMTRYPPSSSFTSLSMSSYQISCLCASSETRCDFSVPKHNDLSDPVTRVLLTRVSHSWSATLDNQRNPGVAWHL